MMTTCSGGLGFTHIDTITADFETLRLFEIVTDERRDVRFVHNKDARFGHRAPENGKISLSGTSVPTAANKQSRSSPKR